jgi:hypothetical protein
MPVVVEDEEVSSLDFFSNEEHILIYQRYQLHPTSGTTHCPNGITDAHNQKNRKKNCKKKKSPVTAIRFL